MSIRICSKIILFSVVILNVLGANQVMADNQKLALSNPAELSLLLSKAKVVDLTQTVNASMPTYDDKAGDFKYEILSNVDKDGYATGAFYTHEHIGTHMDAPIHFCAGGKTIAQLNPADLVLPTIVIDVQKEANKDPNYLLSLEKIQQFEKLNHIPQACAVLLLTGWSKRYWLAGQYRNADNKGVMHFPGFGLEAVKYLINKYKIKAVGIDTLSIDNGPSEEFAVHKLVLSHGLFMIENLTNLDQLPSIGATTIFAPLKIEGGTGSPARVLALVP